MSMEIHRFVQQLVRSASAIQALCADPGLEPHWKPTPEKWSTVEVLCHLADEEREDFRRRLDLTLHNPDEEWPPIDPEGWVKERKYARRDPQEALDDFRSERERSITWLKGLESPDFSIAREHPIAGTLRAGDLLASWVNHDLLHLRQIIGLQHAWIEMTSKPFTSRYAGSW